jgi:BMFP domain-containing protein YqiC
MQCGVMERDPEREPPPVTGDTIMTQTTNRFLDEISRLMNDAAGAAQGVKREIDTVVRHQAERILADLDLVKREEFEAVKEMARLAREENEALKARLAALEARYGHDAEG